MMNRRALLAHSAKVAALLAGSGLLPQLAHANYNAQAFEAKTMAELVKLLGAGTPTESKTAIVFEADDAERRGKDGERVILVREETTPDDLHGMIEAQGILTARGGKTSHAAIVAVGMGKPAVCGVGEIEIDDLAQQHLHIGGLLQQPPQRRGHVRLRHQPGGDLIEQRLK